MNDLEILNQCFEPDFENGILYLKERPREHFVRDSGYKNHLNRVGQDISRKCVNVIKSKKGEEKRYYKEICTYLHGKVYRRYVHRCIYMMYHNILLTRSQVIDHIDGNTLNNSINNLRMCSIKENVWNSRSRSENKNVKYRSGKRKKRWQVEITKDGKTHSFGYYATVEEANKVAKDARVKLFGEFANDG